jgi:hypothetical protein
MNCPAQPNTCPNLQEVLKRLKTSEGNSAGFNRDFAGPRLTLQG